ncbi:hypothetical protein [Paenibacillus caui]|uniref:hypothetical protein n=1 Tax=Paenibacillus caui TaxID=2873927 RepID=UPI001CA9E893|nr:hypothetical protein [Paenibacillus caui]
MNSQSLLELKRLSQFVNKLRDFKIIINDSEVGIIKDGDIKEISLEPSEYEIYLKIDWCRSNKYRFTISENEKIKLECGSLLTGLRIVIPFLIFFYISIGKNRYLYIKKNND